MRAIEISNAKLCFATVRTKSLHVGHAARTVTKQSFALLPL